MLNLKNKQMKNTLELKELGLVELNSTEMAEIEGGSFWGWVAVIAGVLAAVFAGLDYAQTNHII